MIKLIPLASLPAQRFSIQLNKVLVEFFVKRNDRSGVWTFDLKHVVSGAILLHSIPLVLGQELLNPYNLGLGMLFLHDSEALNNVDAGATDLGTRVQLFWTDGDLTT